MAVASTRVRVAVVGTGSIVTSSHLPALRGEADRAELIAAVDVDPDRLDAFRAEAAEGAAGFTVAGYTDLAAMLAAERPDLVHICTPPALHRVQAVAALNAGAWVLCEKPPCLSLAEYDEIAAAEDPGSATGGPYASVVFQHRFGSAARTPATCYRRRAGPAARRPLPDHLVPGRRVLRRPLARTLDQRGRRPDHGARHPPDGSAALPARRLGRDPGDGRAAGARRGERGRLHRPGAVRDGAMASVVNSVLSPDEVSRIRIDFADATVELTHLYGYRNDDWTYTPAPHVPDDPIGSTPGALRPADVPSSHAAQLGGLLDAYETDERPPAAAPDGRRILEFIAALYKSAFTGRPVRRARSRRRPLLPL